MRVCKLTLVILFILLPILVLVTPAQEKEWLSYEPTVVKLKGKLTIRVYYGPPNYGENPDTDTKEALPVLILSKPVNVRGNPDPKAGFNRKSVEGVREIELVLTMPHKEFIGKRVLVKGTLFHAFTGHHHTDVLMDVRSIRLAQKANKDTSNIAPAVNQVAH